jgi:hypothetical protein
MTGLLGSPHRPADRWSFRGWREFGFIAAGLLFAVAGIGVTCPATPARAEDGPPQAEALIRKMIDATGGKAVYAKLQSRFTSGKMSMPKMGIEMSQTSWAQRPNKSYVLMESPALGKIESGCDGSTVWDNSSMAGPSVKKGAERAVLLREADFDNWPNWKKYYKSATTAGADTVAGQATWKVEMVPLEGSPETMWMDQATGLVLKTSMKIQTEMGEVPVDVFMEDYREACGMKLPFRTRQVVMGGMQEMVVTTDSVACDPVVPEGRFALPAEIRALIEEPKTEEAPAVKGEGK